MSPAETDPTLQPFFLNSRDAILICSRRSRNQYVVDFINLSALAMLEPVEAPVCPFLLDALFPATELSETLETAYQTQAPVSGKISPAFALPLGTQLDYEVNPRAGQLVIRLTGPLPPLTQVIGRHIADSSLTSILIFEAVRSAGGSIDDFRLVYQNKTALPQTRISAGEQVGQLMTAINPETKSSGLFHRYVQVVETGQDFQTEHEFSNLSQAFQVAVSRYGDGIIISRYNSTEKQQALRQNQQQAALLQAILRSSQDFIIVCRALRDADGHIHDFKPLAYSQAVIDRGIIPEQALREHTFNQIQMDDPASIDDYIQVVETGASFRRERLFGMNGQRRWFDVTATKLGDGFMIISRDVSAEKEAQRELVEQMNLVEEILNSTTNPIYLAEVIRDEQGVIADFRIVRCNDAGRKNMIRTIGFDGTGSTLLTLYPFSRERGLFASYVDVVETGEAFETEQYYEYGSIRDWQYVAARKVGDGVVVTYTDVTESRLIRQQIEQSAAELRTVIDCAQVAIFLITPVWREATDGADREIVDFRFRIANRKFASYVGQEPDALTGVLASQWFPGYRTTGLFDRYVTLFNTGQAQHFDYHFNTQGYDVWLNVTANKLESEVLVTFSDYTQLKELQHRLEASTTELQTVLNTSQTGIFLFAPVRNEAGDVVDFRFRLANRQLAAYVGQTPEAVIGGLGSVWFPDYQTNGLFDAYYKTYATGETQRFDFHYFGNGIDVWLDIMSTKLGDEVLVTFGDYTPLKRLQQRLEVSVIELQQSNANLEQFAYVASHDLQEPLRKIQSFGDLLRTQYAPVLGADGADLIGRMQSAAARMQVLIKDVLAYSRIATRRDALRPVALNELVQEVLGDLETAITDKRALVRVGPLPTVMGDAPQLRQLFQNLISNALKFTRTGVIPELQLDARLVRGHETGLPVSPADASRLFHLLTFTDNGIGFEPRHAERIFQVFQRLHGRSEYVGTGIGLAIVQKVVQNHQGYIVADGQPGQGATFRMLLPAGDN